MTWNYFKGQVYFSDQREVAREDHLNPLGPQKLMYFNYLMEEKMQQLLLWVKEAGASNRPLTKFGGTPKWPFEYWLKKKWEDFKAIGEDIFEQICLLFQGKNRTKNKPNNRLVNL